MAEEAPQWTEHHLAAVLVAEAGGQGRDGMEAVAETIVNRAACKGWSIQKTITFRQNTRSAHFSCLNGRSIEELYRTAHEHPLFATALQIAQLVYREPDKIPRRVNLANHFARKGQKPWWARDKSPVAVVGDHAFYRL